MKEFRKSPSFPLAALTMCSLYLLNLSFSSSLNDEGVALLKFREKVLSDPYGVLSTWRDEIGLESPCSWAGVCCSEGHVLALNLKDLSLQGTLAPDIGFLAHVKSIILRNNSFAGIIPKEIIDLEQLELLDLGHNSFRGPLPSHLGSKNLNGVILLDNNELLDGILDETYHFEMLSEFQVDDGRLSEATRLSFSNCLFSRNSVEMKNKVLRKLLQAPSTWSPAWKFFTIRKPEVMIKKASPSPAKPPLMHSPSPSPHLVPASRSYTKPSPNNAHSPLLSPSSFTSLLENPLESNVNSGKNHHMHLKLLTVIGGAILLAVLVAGIIFCHCNKVATVKPWATGLSGQLQKAFVTGVPKLKRSELVAACEDFSNVIGSSSVYTLYKGTLSSGVEIAVVSIEVTKVEWSRSMEVQFKRKIDTMSKMNHKNFVNLLGYCLEEKPFTRMMVFEYAPNGTLFEHLHIREAEPLDWAMRLRIAMGLAYCLEHMHLLTPASVHPNLTSSTVYLTEDYAGKLSNFVCYNGENAPDIEPNAKSNVYSFGVILFEIITGKLQYSVGEEYHISVPHLRDMVDPTLTSYHENQLQRLGDVIKLCFTPDPSNRPTMTEVCEMLKEITSIEPDAAIPKLLPLWWAEIEILTNEAN